MHIEAKVRHLTQSLEVVPGLLLAHQHPLVLEILK